jgi:nicotinamidase-related amidase
MGSLDEVLRGKQERIDEFHRLQSGRTALLVIDMQLGFLEPGAALEVSPGRAIIPNVQRLVETCRQQGVPVVFTEFVYSTGKHRLPVASVVALGSGAGGVRGERRQPLAQPREPGALGPHLRGVLLHPLLRFGDLRGWGNAQAAAEVWGLA